MAGAGLTIVVSLQVRLGHIWHVRHQVTDPVAAVGSRVHLCAAATALLAVDAFPGHRRGRLAGGLAVDQAGVVVVLRPGALLDDAAFLVGDGGEAAGVLVDDVEVAQAEDHGYGHHGHHHQRDANRDAPGREVEGLLYGLKGAEVRDVTR